MDKKKASDKASPNNFLQDHNTTTLRFSDTMHRRMTRYLIDGWHTMPELMGGDKCGGNPYQYVRALRGQGIFVAWQRPQGERYGRYKIIHSVSRAKAIKALEQVGAQVYV